MKKNFNALFLIIMLFNGCKTDFDVIAPYKEVMVIDGLLNPLDSIQYIKVSKAFLGEGNALVMAQQKDSINYADVLDVVLENISHNQGTIVLSRSELNNKDSGLFAFPFHVLFETKDTILQDGSKYRIRVTNRQTGITATSTTNIVKAMDVTSPLSNPDPDKDSIDFASFPNSPYIIRFMPNDNSKIIDLIIRFHYREIDPNGNSVEKTVDMNFPDKSNSSSSQEIVYYIYKYDWFQNLGQYIPDKPGFIRRIDSLSPGIKPFEIICLAGTEDLQTYMLLQQPSTGLVQELPTFTTVENGLGLFTSRIIKSLYRAPTAYTIAAFDTSVSVRNKNFQFH